MVGHWSQHAQKQQNNIVLSVTISAQALGLYYILWLNWVRRRIMKRYRRGFVTAVQPPGISNWGVCGERCNHAIHTQQYSMPSMASACRSPSLAECGKVIQNFPPGKFMLGGHFIQPCSYVRASVICSSPPETGSLHA